MNREELLASFTEKAMRIPAPKTIAARSARRPTYSVCRNCGEMMIQDARGGLVCVNGCGSAVEGRSSTEREMLDTSR